MNLKANKQKAPTHVYFRKGRWVFYPYVDGKRGKEVSLKVDGKLLREDAPMSLVWQAYEALHGATSDSIEWLIKKYLKSDYYHSLAIRTKKEYDRYANTIIEFPTKSGEPLGSFPYEQLTPGSVKTYLEKREAKIAANREMEFLSSVFTWAIERDVIHCLNPCKGVRHNKEQSRSRYVEDWEYKLVHKLASEGRSKYIAVMMEFAYLCRARRGELSNRTNGEDYGLLKKDVRHGDYVLLRRSKGSLSEKTLWSERMEQAYQMAKSLNKSVLSPFLIHGKDGHPIKKNAFESAWQRLMAKALQNGLEEKFTFHDIKAKGVSDHEEHHSGHKSEKAKAVYLRQIDEVKSTR